MNSKVIQYTADFDEKRYWERVKRNLGWLGNTDEEAKKRQKKISEVVIGIAGCGGIGGSVAERLVRLGVRHIKVRKTRYQSINTAKNTLKGIECIYALYKKNRRSLQIYGFSPCHEISIMLAS